MTDVTSAPLISPECAQLIAALRAHYDFEQPSSLTIHGVVEVVAPTALGELSTHELRDLLREGVSASLLWTNESRLSVSELNKDLDPSAKGHGNRLLWSLCIDSSVHWPAFHVIPELRPTSPPASQLGDPVNHPSHYTSPRFGVECIDFTRRMTGLAANAFKYIWRHQEKGKLEDLRKAAVYLGWMIEDQCSCAYSPSQAGAILELFHQHMAGVLLDGTLNEVYMALADLVFDNPEKALDRVQARIKEMTS